MKQKLLAIIRSNCGEEIQISLLEQYIDKLLMDTCFEFSKWHIERDDLMIALLGIQGFINDDCSLSKEQLWARFKDDLAELKATKN